MMSSRGGFGRGSSSDSDPTFDVYVARIPPEYDEDKLKELFSPIGLVKGVHVKQAKGDYTQNYCFVKFATEADALCAVRYMNNYQIGETKILVNYRKKDGSTSGSGSESGSHFGGFKSPGPTKGMSSFRGRGGSRSTGFSNRESFEKDDSFLRNGFGNSNDSSSNEDCWDDDVDGSFKDSPSLVKNTPEEENVLAVHIEHPTKFWGQPLSKDNASILDKVTTEINIQGSNAKQVSGQILPGKIVGCKFSVDHLWYRCKVENQSPESGTKVKVRYIDYGNCEVVEQSSLIDLPHSLTQIPLCAKEYHLDLKPVNEDENSEKFRQGVEHLNNLTVNQVLKLVAKSENSATVMAFNGSNVNIAEDMITSGFAVANEQEKMEEKPVFGSVLKTLQPLRTPRKTNTLPDNGVTKHTADLKNEIAGLKTELQSNRDIEEKMKMELAMLKQKNIQLEQSFKRAELKLKDASQSLVNEQFTKMIEEVNRLKKLRGDMHMDDSFNPTLKNAVGLLKDSKKSIKLAQCASYKELLDAENELSANQMLLKQCESKVELGSLVQQRDETREKYLIRMEKFLAEMDTLHFDERQKDLELVLETIQSQFELKTDIRENIASVTEAVAAYENWKAKKIEDVKEMQQNADLCSLKLANNLEILKMNMSLKDEPILVEIGNDVAVCQNVDDLLRQFSQAVLQEISRVKDLHIDTECKSMVANLIASLVKSLHEELDDIKTLRDELRVHYEEKKVDIQKWIKNKPDISKCKETRSLLKSLKSKFRHKQADRRDCEEDSDESDQLVKIEDEIELMKNQLHKVFIEEKRSLRELSRIAEEHFPELNIQHPDLGIAAFMESNGLLHARELEHYDHHSMPLISSSSSSQPLVFTTKFDQKECVIKEYSLDAKLTKDVLKSRMFSYAEVEHPNLVPLDALFFDKAGRKAYLQTAFFGDGNIKTFLETKPGSTELKSLLHGVLKALASLHSKGFVYGSLAPKNVLIVKDTSVAAVLKEPNFSKDELKRFESVASYSSSDEFYPKLISNMESASKELDAFCFGLLMLWAYFPTMKHSGSTQHSLQEVAKDSPVYGILEGLLNENSQRRMTLDDAMNHSFFELIDHRSKSPSEELMSAIKDPGDSFAIIEMNEPVEENDPFDSNTSNSEEKSDFENLKIKDEIKNEVPAATKSSMDDIPEEKNTLIEEQDEKPDSVNDECKLISLEEPI